MYLEVFQIYTPAKQINLQFYIRSTPKTGSLNEYTTAFASCGILFYSPTLHWVNERDNIGAKLFLHFMKAPPSSGQYSSWYPIRCTHHVIAITLVISGFAILQLTQANSRKQLASGAWQPTGFQFESRVREEL